MIKKIKKNILALTFIVSLLIILFLSVLVFLNINKENEFKTFSKLQVEKLLELENIIEIQDKKNVNNLRTTERIFFDIINNSEFISKENKDSIYIDLISKGISQKVKVSKLIINETPLYLNNVLLKKITYMTNTYISIWQRDKSGYLRIASSKAGVSSEEIPILLKKNNQIVKKLEEGERFTSRQYLNSDSELSIFVPIIINGNVEACAEFITPEFIPATISKIYNFKESGFFILNSGDAKLIGNNNVFDLDKDESLIKKVLSLKNRVNKFEYDHNYVFVSYNPEKGIYVGFVYKNEKVFKNYYSFRKTVFIWFILISLFLIITFVVIYLNYERNKKSYFSHIISLIKVKNIEANQLNEKYQTEEEVIEYLKKYYYNISINLENLSQGKTAINISPEFKDSEISNYLEDLQGILKTSIENKQKQLRESELKENLNKGNSQIMGLLQHVSNLEELSFDILKSITNFLGIQQGAMFIFNEKDIENPVFEMIASYAYDKKRLANKIIPANEGLIGRAYLERESVYLTEVPDNYTLIESGFGEEEPKFLLIVPLIFNNKVQAVIELGGINKIEDYKIKFIETAGENIASTISNIKHSKQTEELLFQTTEQSKEIEDQRKTLEEKINTHRRQNRKLDKEMLQLIEIIESIKSVTYMVEYDLNGSIVDVSKKSLNLLGINRSEILNLHHKDIVHSENYEKIYNNFWNELINNKPQFITEIFIINDKKYEFIQSYVPIKNVRRKIFRVLSIGTLKSNL